MDVQGDKLENTRMMGLCEIKDACTGIKLLKLCQNENSLVMRKPVFLHLQAD